MSFSFSTARPPPTLTVDDGELNFADFQLIENK